MLVRKTVSSFLRRSYALFKNLECPLPAASELLVEISDDLFDYEDDVLNNTFNVYRMFLAMYGPAQGQLELAHWISDIERRYERLLSGLEPSLAAKYRERCRSAAKEGKRVHFSLDEKDE